MRSTCWTRRMSWSRRRNEIDHKGGYGSPRTSEWPSDACTRWWAIVPTRLSFHFYEPSPSILSDLRGQPEMEESPETTDRSEVTSPHPAGPPVALGPPQPPPGPQQASEPTPLTNAMRVSSAWLDGDPRTCHSDEEIAALKKEKDMIAFLASRRAKQVATRTRGFQRRTRKREPAEKLSTRRSRRIPKRRYVQREKRNRLIWQKYTNGKRITETEFQEMKKKDPKRNEGHSDALGGNKQSWDWRASSDEIKDCGAGRLGEFFEDEDWITKRQSGDDRHHHAPCSLPPHWRLAWRYLSGISSRFHHE